MHELVTYYVLDESWMNMANESVEQFKNTIESLRRFIDEAESKCNELYEIRCLVSNAGGTEFDNNPDINNLLKYRDELNNEIENLESAVYIACEKEFPYEPCNPLDRFFNEE